MNSTAASNWRDKEYLSVADIRSILSIGESTAKLLVRSLPHVKLSSRLYRVRTSDFIKYLDEHQGGRV